MTEAEFLSGVLYAGRDLGLLMHHAVNRCPQCHLVLPAGTPGFPDVVAIGPHGLMFRELKTRTGKLSPAQRQYAEMLSDGGWPRRFDVWRPADRDRVDRELRAIALPF